MSCGEKKLVEEWDKKHKQTEMGMQNRVSCRVCIAFLLIKHNSFDSV